MAEVENGKKLVREIYRLAFGKANDAVKLVFLDPDDHSQLDKLDLRMVSEIKRGSGGAVEVKLINRIALLELLAKLTEPAQEQAVSEGAQSFYSAMDKAAARLGDGENAL